MVTNLLLFPIFNANCKQTDTKIITIKNSELNEVILLDFIKFTNLAIFTLNSTRLEIGIWIEHLMLPSEIFNALDYQKRVLLRSVFGLAYIQRKIASRTHCNCVRLKGKMSLSSSPSRVKCVNCVSSIVDNKVLRYIFAFDFLKISVCYNTQVFLVKIADFNE